MLVALGATLVDTDAIARALTGPSGRAMDAVAEAFGHGLVGADGALDRARMREIVFSDPSAKRRLEAILHPMIGLEAMRQANEAAGVVVFDVPLMTESSHWRERCDRLVVVDCPTDTQVRRVMARSGWDETQVRSVIAQQATRERRRAMADAVIHNDGLSIDELRLQVERLWAHWFGHDSAL